ncbi:hypothetical protein CCR75_008634 [Bremia lactucae]|uniref:Uncharacterized protein n=1 Tax=Bremia lactucae TaxID=4779 RepID=A0A976FIK2_BRELC|nr:hypothetical protein CCR75_008634 [Bremia lactucae]
MTYTTPVGHFQPFCTAASSGINGRGRRHLMSSGETSTHAQAEPFGRWVIESAVPLPGLHGQFIGEHQGRNCDVVGALSAACGSPT